MSGPGDLSSQPEGVQRAAVVAESRKWLATPYHHNARVRGAGVDCGQILIAVWSDLGLIEAVDPGDYPRDFHLHSGDEAYLAWVERFAARIPDGRQGPGDLVLVQNGRTFSHAGIITDWPSIVHASAPAGMVVEEAVTNSPVCMMRNGQPRPTRFYSYWAKH